MAKAGEFHSLDLFKYDQEYGDIVLCGVDEAGRGPLAGSVYAAAVILPPGLVIDGINDSKKLTEKKREKLFTEITQSAVYCIATASVEEIERDNILRASMLAMKRAVEGLGVVPELVLVDGNTLPNWDYPARSVIDGDATSASIAAASILAKVARDHYMAELDRLYPEYGFAKHKGYGTKLHYQRLLKYGVSEVHRRSFLKKLEQAQGALSARTLGYRGEHYAATYLEKKGYVLLESNYQTKDGEIDLIVQQGDLIAFVEVKSRSGFRENYSPKQAVTRAKQQKLIKTAIAYIQEKKLDCNYRFDVIEVVEQDGKILVNHLERAFDLSSFGQMSCFL